MARKIAQHQSERQVENTLRKYPPIGCLAERHPEYDFAAVLEADGVRYMVSTFHGFVPLPAGLKVKLWGGKIVD